MRQPRHARCSPRAIAAIAVIAGCSAEAPPRPQLVVAVDTDAPVAGQLLDDRSLSGDAVVDTLRIDVLDDAGNAYDYRDFVAPEPSDWPLSFGLAARAEGDDQPIALRLRLFRGGLATSETLNGELVLEPRREIAIDRLVELTPPSEGVRTALVRLSFDCFGAPPSFLAPRTTCIDLARRKASAADGIELVDGDALPASRVGTTALAREIPCTESPPAGKVCVPGGFSVLGDPALWGIESLDIEEALPLRPVIVSRFLIDETELTVGRYRELVRQYGPILPPPLAQEPSDPVRRFCTFRGLDDASSDALPLNCVTWETARRICEVAGGELPTEARWEHAARGRGQARKYPWGEQNPSCCGTSASRESLPMVPIECDGSGVEPAGSHPISDTCESVGDASRDGILDLGGSVTEALLDNLLPYDAACWGSGGILTDPVCEDAEVTGHAGRGGNWASGLATTLAALRRFAPNASPTGGLRCAYEASP